MQPRTWVTSPPLASRPGGSPVTLSSYFSQRLCPSHLFSDYLKIGKFFPIVRIRLPRLRELTRFQFKAKYLYLLRNTASYPMWHDLRLSYQQLRLMIYPCRAPTKNPLTWIIHELVLRDCEDERTTRSAGACAACRATAGA